MIINEDFTCLQTFCEWTQHPNILVHNYIVVLHVQKTLLQHYNLQFTSTRLEKDWKWICMKITQTGSEHPGSPYGNAINVLAKFEFPTSRFLDFSYEK